MDAAARRQEGQWTEQRRSRKANGQMENSAEAVRPKDRPVQKQEGQWTEQHGSRKANGQMEHGAEVGRPKDRHALKQTNEQTETSMEAVRLMDRAARKQESQWIDGDHTDQCGSSKANRQISTWALQPYSPLGHGRYQPHCIQLLRPWARAVALPANHMAACAIGDASLTSTSATRTSHSYLCLGHHHASAASCNATISCGVVCTVPLQALLLCSSRVYIFTFQVVSSGTSISSA